MYGKVAKNQHLWESFFKSKIDMTMDSKRMLQLVGYLSESDANSGFLRHFFKPNSLKSYAFINIISLFALGIQKFYQVLSLLDFN